MCTHLNLIVKVNVVNKQSVVLLNNKQSVVLINILLDKRDGDYYLVTKGRSSGMDPGANNIICRGPRTYVALIMTTVLPLLSCLCPMAIT